MDPDTLEYAPRLARSWEVSPDGLHMRFSLRRDVTFSDGEPMTAEAPPGIGPWRNPPLG